MRADLHIHTYYSDGSISPSEAVNRAAYNGVGLISVTDHDCTLANGEVERLAREAGVKTVRGIEVSAYEGDVKIHTTGYCFEENDSFKGFLRELYDGAVKRTEDIVYKLNKNGFKITFEEIAAERFSEKSPVHAMHVARACAKKGYAADEFKFFFEQLMYGKPSFSNICRPTPAETCEAIRAAGGFSSIAHPGRIDMDARDLKNLVRSLIPCGLGGIEAFYTTHTKEQTAYYIELAREFSLEITGGSDTHFFGGGREIGKPDFQPSPRLLEKLKIE